MGRINPPRVLEDEPERLIAGDIELLTAVVPILCDHCHTTVGPRWAVGIVRHWQPTVWLCATCLCEAFDRG